MKNLGTLFFVTATLCILTVSSFSQLTTTGSGNWSSTSTWIGGVLPTAADDVLIGAGHVITIDDAKAVCNNISFGDAAAQLAMGSASSVLSVNGDFTNFSVSHVPFSAWPAGAKLKFTGSAPIQTLSGWASVSPYVAVFMEVQVDKSAGKVKTSRNNMKFILGTSLEIINGTFQIDSTDDVFCRDLAGTATTPTITVQSGGTLSIVAGATQINSGTTNPQASYNAIGKMTVYGTAEIVTTSTSKINLGGVDVENGGTLRLMSGWGTNTSNYYFASGVVTIKSGGTLRYSSTGTRIWDNANASLVLEAGGFVNITTGSPITFPTNFTDNGGTVRYSYSLPQTGIVSRTYQNLELSGGGTKTLGGAITVNGTLSILDSASLALDIYTFTYGPSASLQYGTSGQTIAQTTTDAEWPSSGGPLNVTVYNGAGVTLHENRTIEGILTLTLGSFDNNGSSDDKMLTLANGATISRARGTLSAAPAFAGMVNLKYTSNVVMDITDNEVPSSTTAIGTFTMSTPMGVTLSKDITINTALELSRGALYLGNNSLKLAGGATVTGIPADTALVVTNGTGEFKKAFSAAGTFSFPVGDSTGGLDLTPALLTLTGGTYSDGVIGVRVVDTKHSSNQSAQNFLKRYWTISVSGISGYSCTAEFSYKASDVQGTETNLVGGGWDGATWTKYSAVNAANHTFSLSTSSLATYTAGESAALAVAAPGSQLPAKNSLSQNYPNPFNPATTLKFEIRDLGFVTLKVFDLLGREITMLVNETLAPGAYQVQWDAASLPSGIYFYTIHAGSFVETRRMILMK